MSKLAEIRLAAAKLGQVASFEKGARYSDFNPSTDKKAGYGIAGLVAAGVGLVAVKKLGILAIMALAGKKLFIIIAALIAGARKWLRNLFRRKKD